MKLFSTFVACIFGLAGFMQASPVAASTSSRAVTPTFDGEGTEASPYLLRTKEDLIALSNMTSTDNYADYAYGNVSVFSGVVFKMANDIDLEYSEDFKGICFTSNSTVARSLKFQGTFDGGGYTIHRLKIDGMVWDVAPSDGAFGTPNTLSSKDAKSFIGQLGTRRHSQEPAHGRRLRHLRLYAVGGIVGRAYAGATIDNAAIMPT